MPSDDIAVSARNLTKTYRLFGHPGNRVKQFLSLGLRRYHSEFTALKDVSFDIKKGETVGIIGRNGSGKSTLLQVICGILKATSGTLTVQGRINALLELGAGFNPEFTGRENVQFTCAAMGFKKAESLARFDEIAAFADIGEFLDHPVRTYSTGMYVRLAFAVQVLSDPDILIIDEALSVGDLFFQQKCLSRIRRLCDNGVTLLFVSHDTNTVRDFCNRSIYLHAGELHFLGDTRAALRKYYSEKDKLPVQGCPIPKQHKHAEPLPFDTLLQDSVWAAPESSHGRPAGRLIAVALYDANGNPSRSFLLGSIMQLNVIYVPAIGISTHVTVEISNKYNQLVTSLGSSRLRIEPPVTMEGQLLIFQMQLTLQIEPGSYSMVVSLGHPLTPNHGQHLDASDVIGPVLVHWDYETDPAPFFGMFGLPVTGAFKLLTSGGTP